MRRPLLFAVVGLAVGLFPLVGLGVDVPAGEVTWLSSGDSYSSGEGVFGNTGDCAQSEDAWGKVAAVELSNDGWSIPLVGFTACTGHLVEDFFNARDPSKGSLYDWGRSLGVPEQVDVLTVTFGGNDIGFEGIIKDCLVWPDSWLPLPDIPGFLSGCDISELEVQERIDALLVPPVTGCVGGREINVVDPDPYACDLMIGSDVGRGTYVDFLVKLARDHVTSRGKLVLVGYPQLFAPTDEWPAWSFAMCKGVKRGDTEKLGRLASYFDAKLSIAVSQANQALGQDRVFYVSARDLYREGSHELCGTGADWLNGVSNNRDESGDNRWEGSFHPNKEGHQNTGQAVAYALSENVAVGGLPTQADLASAQIPAMCGHEPTQLVDGKDVQVGEYDGFFELVSQLSDGGPSYVPLPRADVGGLVAVVASCNAGGVGWPNPIMFFLPNAEFYDSTFVDEYDWRSVGLSGPARNAVTRVSTDDDRRLIVELGMYAIGDGGCCSTASAVVILEAENGEIVISEVVSYDPGVQWTDPIAVGQAFFGAWRDQDEPAMRILAGSETFLGSDASFVPEGDVECREIDDQTVQCDLIAEQSGELFYVIVRPSFGGFWKVAWASVTNLSEGGCC